MFSKVCVSVGYSFVKKIPFRRQYRTGLADAFDVYLSILRDVDKQVSVALERTTPNWRVLNACPPCGYEVCPFNSAIFTG
jgi:hypothetical protein